MTQSPRGSARTLFANALAAALLALATPALAAPGSIGPRPGVPSDPVAPLDRAGLEALAVERFGPAATLTWDPIYDAPRALRRISAPTGGADPAERALGFLERHRDLLRLAPGVALHLAETRPHRDGVVVTFAAHLGGLPLVDRTVTVSLDLAHRARTVRLDPLPQGLLTPATDVGAEGALAAVIARFGVVPTGRPLRVALADAPGPARVAWRVLVAPVPLVNHHFVWVDAASGDLVKAAPAGKDQLPLRHGGGR